MNETVKSVLEKVKATAVVAGEAAGRAAGQAGKKAGELWEITRLNVQISSYKDEMETYYKKIGELVFQTHHDPNMDTDCVEEWLLQMDEIEAEIADIKERITELRQVRACPGCGKNLGREDQFCRFCGQETEA